MALKYIYAALLRGINVGGSNVIKMEDLKKAFVEMGFSGVKTCIASGNVIFVSPEKDKTLLSELIEKNLSDRYKTCLRLVIVSFKEYKAIIEKVPKDFGKDAKIRRYDVWFLKAPLAAEEVMKSLTLREGVDSAAAGKGVVYTSRLTVMSGKSHLVRINKLPVYQDITVRNWNTVQKIFELMGE